MAPGWVEGRRRTPPSGGARHWGGSPGAGGPRGGGWPRAPERAVGDAHDEVMNQSILDFYRSAVPNVSAGWWEEITGPARSRGLVLLLPDPPEHEAMSLQVAERLGAEIARLDDLNHCWMAEAPEVAAPVLERFWASLD